MYMSKEGNITMDSKGPKASLSREVASPQGDDEGSTRTSKEQSSLLTSCIQNTIIPHKEGKRMLHSSYFAFTFPVAFATGHIGVT